MSGFFGAAAKEDCVFDLFFGVDYHSHLGTRRGGMIVYGDEGEQSLAGVEPSKYERGTQSLDLKRSEINCLSIPFMGLGPLR